MKSIAYRREQGISEGKINLLMLTLAVLVTVLLFCAMRRTTDYYDAAHNSTQNLIASQRDADQLMKASDYLTDEIRKFAITGEKQYLDNYFEEANVTKRREAALEALKVEHKDSAAYEKLEAAMSGSLDLMNDEYYAAKLIVVAHNYNQNEYPKEVTQVALNEQDADLTAEEKIKRAQAILFGEQYNLKKQNIVKNMSECLDAISAQLENIQSTESDKLRKQVRTEHFLTAVLIAVMFLTVLMTSLLIIRPLRKMVDLIREEKDIPLKGAYEVRFLAKTYNLMFQTNMANREKLTYEAMHDNLTGLYNRRGYDFLLKNVDMETSTLLLIDLDKFKQINDSNGHDIGDKVLKKVADTIFNNFRSQDYICRIGGDEFAVIVLHSNSSLKQLICKKVEKINEELQRSENGLPPISISVGVAFGDKGMSVESLFKSADESLYEAKSAGRSSVKFHIEENEETPQN